MGGDGDPLTTSFRTVFRYIAMPYWWCVLTVLICAVMTRALGEYAYGLSANCCAGSILVAKLSAMSDTERVLIGDIPPHIQESLRKCTHNIVEIFIPKL